MVSLVMESYHVRYAAGRWVASCRLVLCRLMSRNFRNLSLGKESSRYTMAPCSMLSIFTFTPHDAETCAIAVSSAGVRLATMGTLLRSEKKFTIHWGFAGHVKKSTPQEYGMHFIEVPDRSQHASGGWRLWH